MRFETSYDLFAANVKTARLVVKTKSLSLHCMQSKFPEVFLSTNMALLSSDCKPRITNETFKIN